MRHHLKRATCLTLISALTLSSCAVGPNYHRPSAPAPAAFKELDGWKPATPRDDFDKGQWWTLFGDPDLDRLEADLVVSNQNLAAATAAYSEARDVVAENRASLFPTVNLTGGATRSGGGGSSRSGVTTGTGGTGTGGTGTGGTGTGVTGSNSSAAATRYDLGLGATWQPDLFGRVRRTIENARATAQASAADLANVRLTLQSELAVDYLEMRADDEELRLLKRTQEGYQRALKVAQNRYNAGVAAKSEVLSADTQLLNDQASIQATTQQRQILEHAVAVLSGKPPSELSLAPKPFVLNIPKPPVAVPSTLLERRPDIAVAERRAAAASALIGVNVAAYFPTLDLSASYGLAATSLSKLFSAGAWSLGASAAETLFDAGARRARVRASRAAYQQAVAQYRQTVLTAFQQVEDELVAVQRLQTEDALRRQASAEADQAEQIVINQYRAGQASPTEVVTAENTALTARVNMITTQSQLLTATVTLIEALGGGWSASELPKRP